MPRRTSTEKPLPQAPRQRQQSSRQEPQDQKYQQQQHYSSGSSSSTSYRESYHPPIHKQVVYFVRTVPGLERTLRLVQALAQVVTEVASSHEPVAAAKCASLRGQLALSIYFFPVSMYGCMLMVVVCVKQGDTFAFSISSIASTGRIIYSSRVSDPKMKVK